MKGRVKSAKPVYVPKRYLKITDRGATFDMEKKSPEHGMTAECPACHGYGGWHLELDAYGPGKHFDCFCGNCNGWGYVAPKDAGHVHEFEEFYDEEKANAVRAVMGLEPIRFTRGNCCHNHLCRVCGDYRFVDSSD